MAVERDIAPGTPVVTADGKPGSVLRSYPGTSVVTVRIHGAIMSLMRHELYYAATEPPQVEGFHQQRGG
jgi:hypothetical protein